MLRISHFEEKVKESLKEKDVVSFKFSTTVNGIPKRPTIYNIRHDLTWDDVLFRLRKLKLAGMYKGNKKCEQEEGWRKGWMEGEEKGC